MHPSEIQWASFYRCLNAKTGLDLQSYKQDQLRRRIISMVEGRNITSLEDFWAFLKGGDENLTWFQDKLAINVSELFRNPEKWVELQRTVLPELLAKSPRLKIWSAGCSYGAEAHTLAMILDAHFPGPHQIIGTDIDDSALAQAKKGEFSEADVRNVPADKRKIYLQQANQRWVASPQLRKYLTFRRGNLLSDRFDSGYDLIICRNVVIYFTESAKDSLYKKFFQALKPGGYMFVGSTERIFNSRDIGLETPFPFFYRKQQQGETLWRNAS